jgi:magnesium-transporting ATPase (P-type)
MGFDPELLKEIDRIIAEYAETHDEIEHLWSTQMVFTWHWWFDVALAVLPWLLWFIVRDRKKQHSLFYAGLFTMLIASLLDMTGVSQGAWNYNTLLLPYFPEFLPWDLTVMPVTAMLFYQFFPRISPWLKGVVFGIVAAYVVEPFFIWLGIYEPNSWEHHYSLPIYFVIYMIGYWLYSRNLRQTEKHAGI